MSAAQITIPGKKLHAELTARLRRVPMRRWRRESRAHVGAWCLTGGLRRRIVDLRDMRAGRIGVRPALRAPHLALPLLRRWRGSQDEHVWVKGAPVSVVLRAHFRSQFVVATTSRLAGSGAFRRETTRIHSFHTRSVRDRLVLAAQGSLRTERQSVSRYVLSSGPSPATIATSTPHFALVLLHLHSQKSTALRPRDPRLTIRSVAGIAPAAVHGRTTVFSSAPQSLHTMLMLKQTAKIILWHLHTLRESTFAWLRSAWSHQRGYAAPRLPAHVTAMPETRSRTLLTLHKTSTVRDAIMHAFVLPPLRLAQRSTADRESPPAQFSAQTPMPLISPTRPAQFSAQMPMPLISPTRPAQGVALGSVEPIQSQITMNVLKRVESVVEREIHRHMRFDAQDVRRLRERLYADLGSRIVFERERLGRT